MASNRVQATAQGDVAHDGVDTGNPVKIGGKALDFSEGWPPSDVAAGDRVNAAVSLKGVLGATLFDGDGAKHGVNGNPLYVTAAASGLPISQQSDVAEDSAPAGVVVGVSGGIGSSVPRGPVTAGDAVAFWLSLFGALNIIPRDSSGNEILFPAALGAGGGLKVDGSGTALPVSGTLTANAGTNLNTSALALEATQAAGNVLTGAVSETAPATDTANSGLNGRLQRIAQRLSSLIAIFTIGAGTEAAAVRVTLPTDGTGKIGTVTTVSTVSSVTAIAGALPAGNNNIGDVDVATVPADPFGANADAVVAAGATGSIQAKLRRVTQGLEDLKTTIVLAAGSAAIGKLAANSGVDIGDVDVTSLPKAATSAVTSVNDSASSVTLLASNAARFGYKLFNDSTYTAYVKEGTTATTADYSYQLLPGAFYEDKLPYGYTGRIDCIWAANGSGAMKCTELSA